MALTTRSEADTRNFGKELAKKLKLKDIVALFGELGSGKTQIVKGICEGLGVKDVVNSPTYIIVNEYNSETIPKIYHFDLYRLTDSKEVIDIGFDEYIQQGLCLIEWPEIIEDILPSNTKKIYISHTGKDENSREIRTENFE